MFLRYTATTFTFRQINFPSQYFTYKKSGLVAWFSVLSINLHTARIRTQLKIFEQCSFTESKATVINLKILVTWKKLILFCDVNCLLKNSKTVGIAWPAVSLSIPNVLVERPRTCIMHYCQCKFQLCSRLSLKIEFWIIRFIFSCS